MLRGSGPVIVNGPQGPRVDVQTVLLCDVLPDGTVAGTALVEPIYDTNTGPVSAPAPSIR